MNAWKRGLLVGGTLIALALAAGVFVGVGGMAVARPDEKETAKPISAWDIVEKLDGKEAKATVVEVTLGPGGRAAPPPRPGYRVRPGGRVRTRTRRPADEGVEGR
jgi:hypothetical protein